MLCCKYSALQLWPESNHIHYANKWVCLCPNKTLFVNMEIWISYSFYVSQTILLLIVFQTLQSIVKISLSSQAIFVVKISLSSQAIFGPWIIFCQLRLYSYPGSFTVFLTRFTIIPCLMPLHILNLSHWNAPPLYIFLMSFFKTLINDHLLDFLYGSIAVLLWFCYCRAKSRKNL